MSGGVINDMAVFVAVVEAGSLTAAAKRLGLPKSTVSRRLEGLERRLGVQLIVRSTRAAQVTDVGKAYWRRCVRVLAEVAEAEAEAMQEQMKPRGRLKVTTPVLPSGSEIGEMFAAFLGAYPEVALEVLVTNRYVDLLEEGVDVALRAGQLKDSLLTARQIARTAHVVVASPGYLERAGTPRALEDVEGHACLLREGVQTWRGVNGQEVRVWGRMVANDLDILRDAVVAGLGLAWLPEQLIAQELASGVLVHVLADALRRETGMFFVYAAGRMASAKVRAFVEFGARFLEEAQGNAETR
jgi:DNA-binding transcriptional LysR family regulator